ncbi:ATP-binding protein [Lactococcus muris]|uniref:ATP-binding protein n=1 Tax=Lactococcus muris TaxID=2941330 RepID=UPI0023005BA4
MKLSYPIEKYKDNLVLTKEREVMAFYSIPYFSSSSINFKKKEETKESIEKAIKKLLPNAYFELSLVPRDFLLEEKMSDLADTFVSENKKSGEIYLKEVTARYTKEMEIPYKYVWLLGVYLSKEMKDMSFKELIKTTVNKQTTALMHTLGRVVQIREDWFEEWRITEMELRQTLSALKPVPLSHEQMYYYQRLQFLPYIPHLFKDVLGSKSVHNVTDTMIYANNMGELQFVSPYGTSYLSILPIGKSTGILSNNHMDEIVQSFNFPIGLKKKCHFPDMKSSFGYKSKMSQSLVRSKTIMRETANTGNVMYDRIIIGRQALNDMAKKVEAKAPIIEYGAFLFVAASSREQLRSRVKTAIQAFDGKFVLERARMDQAYLFQALLYGAKLDRTTRFWYHSSDSAGFSQHLPFTTTKSGSDSGFPLGRIDTNYHKWEDLNQAIHASRNIVLYNPMLANKEGIAGKITKNLLTTITGMTGSGKTILAQYQFLQAVHSKIKTLYIDPKHSIRAQWLSVSQNPVWRDKNPELAAVIDRINFVTLDYQKAENRGVLDPIVFLSPEDALTVAKTMLKYLGEGTWKKEESTAISKAVKAVVKRKIEGESVGFMHVLDLLKDSEKEDVRAVGEYLFEAVEGSILSLAFSYGQVEGISFEEHATVLEISDLELPESDSEDELSEEERHSVALMMALGTFCKRFGSMNDREETIEFMDEVWVIMTSKEGKRIIKSMKRVGRSQNNKLVLISQSVNDVKDSNDTTGAGERFCFYEDGEEEHILRTLKLEVNETNIQWIRNMNQGQCVYLDVFGNINRVSIEIPAAWLELFAPKNDSEQSQLEKHYQKH